MREALKLAKEAASSGEVPVGAVVVLGGLIVGRGSNKPIGQTDPTAHAEIVAVRRASRAVGNYRLPNADLYVTLEPCTMCAGAIVLARIRTVIFGATDTRAGGVCSCCKTFETSCHNHRVEWRGGVLARESSELLKGFFKERR